MPMLFTLPVLALKTERYGYAQISKRSSGDGTFYDLNSGLTACGTQESNSNMVVALSVADFGPGSNGSPSCDECILVTGPKGSQLGHVKDKCMGCQTGAVDMSPAMFAVVVGSEDVGRTGVSWVRAPCSGQTVDNTTAVNTTLVAQNTTEVAQNTTDIANTTATQ
eukprot:NODE_915_length_3084_cov_1.262894.p3 type:complete len:165 gc:universal NODE_915_length_3084_cov_1.262894:2040-1546(-)